MAAHRTGWNAQSFPFGALSEAVGILWRAVCDQLMSRPPRPRRASRPPQIRPRIRSYRRQSGSGREAPDRHETVVRYPDSEILSSGSVSNGSQMPKSEASDVSDGFPCARCLGEGEAPSSASSNSHRPRCYTSLVRDRGAAMKDCRSAPGVLDASLPALDPAARVMSLSAIVLEEAYGRGGASSQDDWLTALELQSLDLQGTKCWCFPSAKWRMAFLHRAKAFLECGERPRSPE